jgi:hypothetical protein
MTREDVIREVVGRDFQRLELSSYVVLREAPSLHAPSCPRRGLFRQAATGRVAVRVASRGGGDVMADEDLLLADADDGRESAADKLARYMARPHAAQVQAETSRAGAQAGKGLKCHCQNFRVLATRPGEDSKTRRRICRCCGYVFHTCEFVTSDLTPESLLEAMARKLQQ